mmetsp:Transcript_6535/g.9361  ORF Transcript_6535/g.9361 Transcript_6535/m.9361 type:complete len:414 (+) Transcript_6535:266-1507(+)
MNQLIRSVLNDERRLDDTNGIINGSTISSIVCGETVHQLKMEGCSDENPHDCERTYSLYIPSSICHNNTEQPQGGVIPLVFAIHCFGCPPTAMQHWQKVGEEFNFAVVIPTGIQRSWNAKYCCGYALRNQLDDVGFLHTIITNLHDQYSFVSADVTYAVGWSNGGYMVTYASKLFRSIAPIAGYQYDDLLEISNDQPRGIFMHHSSNDPLVQITGCCTDSSMPRCCCGISNNAQSCTSITSIFERWATEVNRCSSNTTEISLVGGTPTNQVQCVTATGTDCLANTTLCVYQDKAHFTTPSFEAAFPMTANVADFFARDACSLHDGTWSSTTKSCSCKNDDDDNSSYFCLEKGDTTTKTAVNMHFQTNDFGGNTSIGTIIGVVCFFLLGFIIIAKSKSKYIGWKQVPTDDVRSQ